MRKVHPTTRTLMLCGPLVLSLVFARCGPPKADPPWELAGGELQETNTDALFIAVSAASERVAWAAGTGGRFGRTVDGGSNWEVAVVPGADSLQFRDVHAIDANSAYILSIGNGSDSRVYRTDDAGKNWTLLFQNSQPDAFFDCMGFWDEDSGIAFSDAVDSEFVIITTNDGGATWSRVDPGLVPDAIGAEGSFAASGTCVATIGDSTAWIGTGAGERPRVLKTTDRGKSWIVAETPLPGGSSSGIATVTFRDPLNGFIAGGDISAPTVHTDNVAVTHDGGRTWTLAAQPLMPGAIYGSTYVPGAPTPTIVVTGPAGVNYSVDNGISWLPADTLTYWGVAFAGKDAGWTVGTDGKIALRYFRSSR